MIGIFSSVLDQISVYSNGYSIFDHFKTLIRSIKEPKTFTERKSFLKYQITDLHFHISNVQRRLRFLDMHVAFDFRLAQIGLNLIYFHSWVALIRECYLPCKRWIEKGKEFLVFLRKICFSCEFSNKREKLNKHF